MLDFLTSLAKLAKVGLAWLRLIPKPGPDVKPPTPVKPTGKF